jgi:hypothetical protein
MCVIQMIFFTPEATQAMEYGAIAMQVKRIVEGLID